MSNKEVKWPGPPIGYVDILDIATQNKVDREAAKRDKNPLRPSSAGKCAREKAYEYHEFRMGKMFPRLAEELITPEKSRTFSLGHSIEWNLLNQFDNLVEAFEVRYKQQVLSFHKLSEVERVEGSIDFVFWSHKWKCIGDVKSKGDPHWVSWKDGQLISSWDKTDGQLEEMKTVEVITARHQNEKGKWQGSTAYWVEDLPAFLTELKDPYFRMNFMQLNMYAVNPFIVERGIDHACILQFNKNNSRLREVRFKPNHELYDYVVKVDQEIVANFEAGGGPEQIACDYQVKAKCGCKKIKQAIKEFGR